MCLAAKFSFNFNGIAEKGKKTFIYAIVKNSLLTGFEQRTVTQLKAVGLYSNTREHWQWKSAVYSTIDVRRDWH